MDRETMIIRGHHSDCWLPQFLNMFDRNDIEYLGKFGEINVDLYSNVNGNGNYILVLRGFPLSVKEDCQTHKNLKVLGIEGYTDSIVYVFDITVKVKDPLIDLVIGKISQIDSKFREKVIVDYRIRIESFNTNLGIDNKESEPKIIPEEIFCISYPYKIRKEMEKLGEESSEFYQNYKL